MSINGWKPGSQGFGSLVSEDFQAFSLKVDPIGNPNVQFCQLNSALEPEGKAFNHALSQDGLRSRHHQPDTDPQN